MCLCVFPLFLHNVTKQTVMRENHLFFFSIKCKMQGKLNKKLFLRSLHGLAQTENVKCELKLFLIGQAAEPVHSNI